MRPASLTSKYSDSTASRPLGLLRPFEYFSIPHHLRPSIESPNPFFSPRPAMRQSPTNSQSLLPSHLGQSPPSRQPLWRKTALQHSPIPRNPHKSHRARHTPLAVPLAQLLHILLLQLRDPESRRILRLFGCPTLLEQGFPRGRRAAGAACGFQTGQLFVVAAEVVFDEGLDGGEREGGGRFECVGLEGFYAQNYELSVNHASPFPLSPTEHVKRTVRAVLLLADRSQFIDPVVSCAGGLQALRVAAVLVQVRILAFLFHDVLLHFAEFVAGHCGFSLLFLCLFVVFCFAGELCIMYLDIYLSASAAAIFWWGTPSTSAYRRLRCSKRA